MTNKYTKKFKRSNRARRSKHSRKLQNSLTHRARLNKLQDGGLEHYNKKSTEMEERTAERSKQLSQKGSISPRPGVQQVASTSSSSVNILKILKNFLMRK
jgi:hypothetical protein